MEHIILVCKHRDERLAVESENCTSYHKLVELISDKWEFLKHEELNLLYSTPGLDRFLLKDSADYNAMIRMASIFNMKYIEIEVKAPFVTKDQMSAKKDRMNILATIGDDVASSSRVLPNEMSIVVQSSTDTPLLSAYWGIGISHVGQIFKGGRDEFRVAVVKYAIHRGFSVSYKRNDKNYVRAYCKKKFENFETPCPWMVSASLCSNKKTFVICQFINYHTCEARLGRDTSKQLSSKIVATLITKPMVVSTKKWAANDVVNHMKSSYGQVIEYKMAWHALLTANEKLFGDDLNSYQQLWWYTRAAMDTNNGSKIVLDLDEQTYTFKRIFVSWGACIEGFKDVRPMLFLDGTHLKGKFLGVLLSATGKNANQELYPLAYAIVDSETGDNWLWFMENLRDVVGYDRNITFISDRHPGLLDSIKTVFHESEKKNCLHHLQDNLRGKYNGKTLKSLKDHVVSLFTDCARAATPSAFALCLQELLSEGGRVVENFLKDLPFHKWTNAYGGAGRYGEMTSNAAESFNSWIRDARELPITQCIDKLRQKLMQWFVERRANSAKWTGFICQNMESKLEKLIEEGRTWRVTNADHFVFEVITDNTFSVNLSNHTCSCNIWQLNGFPCAHAIACVNSSTTYRMQDYIDDYWIVGRYKKSYAVSIMPIPNSMKEHYMFENDQNILPPQTKRPTGRPKKERFKTKGERENIKIIRCSRCKKLGHHNKKSCKAPINS